MNKRMWPGMVFVLVGSLVTMNLTMLVISTRDPSFAVHSTRDRGAEAWAEHRAQLVENDRLGYDAELRVPGHAPDGAAMIVEVQLTDAASLPLEAQDVSVELFHRARPHEVVSGGLRETAPGRYATTLPLDRSGVWEYTLTASSAAGRYQVTDRKYILTGGGGS